MSISKWFNTTIAVQTETVGFGGEASYETDGSNMGYIRLLSANELSVYGKPELTVTHKAVMATDYTASFGKFLYDGTNRYKVQPVNPQTLSGGGFQTVICERVI